MSLRIIQFFADPVEPMAGQTFRLHVKLAEAPPADVDVLLEKQRIVANSGGFPELRPTGATYFLNDPLPIRVKAGTTTGVSEDIAVLRNPQAPSGDPPVRFPEKLLFTSFGGPFSQGFTLGRCLVVSVNRID